jgi:hypothetical protein
VITKAFIQESLAGWQMQNSDSFEQDRVVNGRRFAKRLLCYPDQMVLPGFHIRE